MVTMTNNNDNKNTLLQYLGIEQSLKPKIEKNT